MKKEKEKKKDDDETGKRIRRGRDYRDTRHDR